MSFLRRWLEKRGYVKIETYGMTIAEGHIVPVEPPPRWAEVLPASPSILVARGLAASTRVDEGWEDVDVDDTVTTVIDIEDVELTGLALGTVDWAGPRDETQVLDLSEVLDSRSVNDAPRALAPGVVPIRGKSSRG